jgi:hypothetical protein
MAPDDMPPSEPDDALVAEAGTIAAEREIAEERETERR